MRPALFAVLVLLAGLFGGVAGWYVRAAQAPPPPPPAPTDATFAAGLDTLEARVRAVRARFERVREPLPDEEAFLRRPRTPPYARHLRLADSLGVGPVTSAAQIDRLAAAGRLVPLVDTDLYTVRILEHSAPFVTPDTRRLVDRIGRRFRAALDAEGLPHYRLTISSATRTPSFQEELRASNRNAAVGTSTHEYGVSVDFVYTRWRYHPRPGEALPEGTPHREALERMRIDRMQALGAEYADRLFGVLARVLGEVQREREALVLLEAEQPVFHLTLARRFGARAEPPPPDTTRADSLAADTLAADSSVAPVPPSQRP